MFDSAEGIALEAPGEVYTAAPLNTVEMVDEATLPTEFGTFRSLNSFAVQSLRGGYTVRSGKHRAMFTVGLENLTNRLYFEHFQTSPAPGRGFVFGTTVELGQYHLR